MLVCASISVCKIDFQNNPPTLSIYFLRTRWFCSFSSECRQWILRIVHFTLWSRHLPERYTKCHWVHQQSGIPLPTDRYFLPEVFIGACKMALMDWQKWQKTCEIILFFSYDIWELNMLCRITGKLLDVLNECAPAFQSSMGCFSVWSLVPHKLQTMHFLSKDGISSIFTAILLTGYSLILCN